MHIFSLYGNLPSASQLQEWEFAISQHSALPQGVLVSFTFINSFSNFVISFNWQVDKCYVKGGCCYQY